MVESNINRGPADRTRINIEDEYEIQFWARELGVSRLLLARAVEQVGPGISAVRRHLSR